MEFLKKIFGMDKEENPMPQGNPAPDEPIKPESEPVPGGGTVPAPETPAQPETPAAPATPETPAAPAGPVGPAAPSAAGGGEETFVCETCGQTKPISQKRAHDAEHGGNPGSGENKNVCEFC